MKCAARGCNANRILNSSKRLCAKCEKSVNMMQRIDSNSDRQSQSRAVIQDSNRVIDNDNSSEHHHQQSPCIMNNNPSSELAVLRASYSENVARGSHEKIFTDMYAMLIQVLARQE